MVFRTGGLEEEQRMGFSSTAQHTKPFQSCPAQWEQAFPVLWHTLGTGIPSAAAGMAGLVLPAVWGQVFGLSL